MRRKLEISERQARVGIVANPAKVSLPVPIPRDTMARWPDLRSPRRLRRFGLPQKATGHSGLPPEALNKFADELRQKRSRPASFFSMIQAITGWRARM
jgi:hypothetical protein